MRTKTRILLQAAVLFSLLACSTPMTSTEGGSIRISIGNNLNARTLAPALDMNAASYVISGAGPEGATFTQTVSGTGATVSSLAFGAWSITVNAFNAADTLIGSGQASVTVTTGVTTNASVSVVPLAGDGTLDLAVNWTASQVQLPSVQASLTGPSGSPVPLTFAVSGNQGTYSSSTIPAGYKTLIVQLLDNGISVMGAVEVVRIVAGQTTSGIYTFSNVNQPGGTIAVNISPDLGQPLTVSLSGVAATVTAGSNLTATASVSDGTPNVVYVWYLNGASVATGSSYTFGSSLTAGYYRLDVTAFTTDGKRAGSSSAEFQVGGSTVAVPAVSGTVTTLAGAGIVGNADGTGNAASFNYPVGIATDGVNVYVADSNNSQIRKVVIATGQVTTLAGSLDSGHADGFGSAAGFNYPYGIATDGVNLYVADTQNHEIRRIVISTGEVTTLAGSLVSGHADGIGSSASFYFPFGIATDGINLYVADTYNHEIRKIVIASRQVTTLAGSLVSGHADGTGSVAGFSYPSGLATDGVNLYVADNYNQEIRKIVIATGQVTTLAGSLISGHDDGVGGAASFCFPFSLATEGGNLYVADMENSEIRKIVITSGQVSTLAGSPAYGAADGIGSAAGFHRPYGITTDGTDIYVADTENQMIRKIVK